MKILLVSWCKSPNLGTDLQAIALYKLLNKDNDCSLLIQRHYYPFTTFVKKAFKKVFHTKSSTLSSKEKIDNINRCFADCKKETINNRQELKEILNNYSVYVVGSDQVWNPYYLSDTYLLDFVPNDNQYKKLSYASSIGVKAIPEENQFKFKKYLSNFTWISTRENEAAVELQKIIGRNVNVVLDPTLLLTSDDWRQYAKDYNLTEELPDRYILGYFVRTDINHWDKVVQISSEYNLPLVIMPINEWDYKVNAILACSAGPKEFIKLVEKAEFICTDSFHMCAFSINFNKQFAAFQRFKSDDSKAQSSRIEELFHRFKLDRYYKEGIYDEKIDYYETNLILNSLKTECCNMLLSQIDT